VKSGGQLVFKGPECLRAVRDGLVPIAEHLNTQQVGDEPFMGVERHAVSFAGIARGTEDPAQAHQARVREDRGQEQSEDLYVVPWPNQYLHLKVKVDAGRWAEGASRSAPPTRVRRTLGFRRHGPHCDAVGRAAARIVVGRPSPRFDLGRVGRRWQVLGVPEVLLCDQPAWSSDIVAINNDVWKKIKPEHQKAITDLAAKLEPEFWESAFAADKDCAKKMVDGGMQLVTPSPP